MWRVEGIFVCGSIFAELDTSLEKPLCSLLRDVSTFKLDGSIRYPSVTNSLGGSLFSRVTPVLHAYKS